MLALLWALLANAVISTRPMVASCVDWGALMDLYTATDGAGCRRRHHAIPAVVAPPDDLCWCRRWHRSSGGAAASPSHIATPPPTTVFCFRLEKQHRMGQRRAVLQRRMEGRRL
jgi:hypothetical protein